MSVAQKAHRPSTGAESPGDFIASPRILVLALLAVPIGLIGAGLLAAAGAANGPATAGELAERSQLRPHSVDELITRAEANGLVSRHRGSAK